MNEKKNKPAHRFANWLLVLPALLLVGLVALGFYIWRSYRNDLMDNQKEQLMLVTQTASNNLQSSFFQYRDNLEFLASLYETYGADKALYHSFLESQDTYVVDICLLDAAGVLTNSINGCTLTDAVPLFDAGAACTVSLYSGAAGQAYLGFCKQLSDGRSLCLVVDEVAYYTDLISDLRIGTNGYLLVKTSGGRIIMHPERSQWGIDVIEGRQQLYPDLDLTSLADMVQLQLSEPRGVYEYYSYWWSDPALPRVKKISAHDHIDLGEDFWVVSAVVDYSDFYTPLASGFGRLAFVFAAGSIILLGLALYIGKLLRNQRRDSKEIAYLRELNEVLEELHRHEENIAHQQRLQVMGAMTGGIAHEFNNFLTPIMGFAELLLAELPPDSGAYDNAQEIYQASDKAKDVVRQISAMSRKNVETVYKSTPAKQTLTHTLKMIESVCPPQIHLKSELSLGDECFLGNRTQINQVLLNLCVNAIHAIGGQEGTLLIKACCLPRAEVAAALPDERLPAEWAQYLQIEVIDNGCGMDGETQRHIFEPFFTTKKSGEGTGLGLSLADQIVRAHRGFLAVQSEVGKGSTFQLYLPVVEQGAATASLQWGQEQKLRIVVADDNPKVLEMLKTSFAKLGLPLVTCRKKQAVLAQLEQAETDVLAIDQSLEDGDGIDFCMSIQGRYPGLIKLLMVDGVTREIVEARRRGIIDGYAEKPVSDATLLEAIRSSQHREG